MPIESAIAVVLACVVAHAADNGSVLLRNWLQSVARRQLAACTSEVDRTATCTAEEARGRQVRATLLRLMGGLRETRTPLNIRTVGVIQAAPSPSTANESRSAHRPGTGIRRDPVRCSRSGRYSIRSRLSHRLRDMRIGRRVLGLPTGRSTARRFSPLAGRWRWGWLRS